MNKRTAYYEDLDRQAKEKMEEARRVRRSYEERLMEAEEEIRQRGEEVQKSAAAQAGGVGLHQTQGNEVRGQISDMVAMATERLVLDSTSTAYDQFLAAAGEDD